MTGRNPIDRAFDHVQGMERNYSYWPTTFANCPTDGCEGSGRGGGMCADCHEKALAEIAGKSAADVMHSAIKDRMKAWSFLRDALDQREREG